MPLAYNDGNKPHFSAVAVGAVKGGQLIWVLTDYRDERCQPPKQQFKLPGGTAEMFEGDWENPFETAVRELDTEVGVSCGDLIEVCSFEAGVNHRHFYFLAWFGSDQSAIKERHQDDAGEYLEFSWQSTDAMIGKLTTRHLKGFQRVLECLAMKLRAEALAETDASKAKLVLEIIGYNAMALERIDELDRLEDSRRSRRRLQQQYGPR